MSAYVVTKYLYSYPLSNGHTFLMNLLTGAADVVDAESFRWLENQHPEPSLEALFLERHYIFRSQDEEQALKERLIDTFTETATATPSLCLCPTYACNLSCTYCFEQNQPVVHQARFMTRSQVRDAFDAFDQVLPPGRRRKVISFFGGEPFLPSAREAVEEALIQARERGYRCNAVTNGIFAPTYIPLFTRYREQVGSFRITIDGPPAIHDIRRKNRAGKGTYRDVARGVSALLEAGFQVDLQTLLDRQNFPTLGQFLTGPDLERWTQNPNFRYSVGRIGYFYDGALEAGDPYAMGIAEFNQALIPLVQSHPLRERIHSYSAELNPGLTLHKHLHGVAPWFPNILGCSAVQHGRYFFGPDGLVYPCSELIGVERAAVGAYEGGLAWNPTYARWRERTPHRMNGCSECRFLFLCGGGCPVQSLKDDGDLNRIICPPNQAILDRYLADNRDHLLSLFGLHPDQGAVRIQSACMKGGE